MYEYLKFKEGILSQCPHIPVDALISKAIAQKNVPAKALHDILLASGAQVICLDARTILLRTTSVAAEAIKPLVDDIHMQKNGEYIVYLDADRLMYTRMLLKDTNVSPDITDATSYANRIGQLIDMPWYRNLLHIANDVRIKIDAPIPAVLICIESYQAMARSTLWPLYKTIEGRTWCMKAIDDTLTISALDATLDLPLIVTLLPDGSKASIKGRTITLHTSLAQSILAELKEIDVAMHPVSLDYIW